MNNKLVNNNSLQFKCDIYGTIATLYNMQPALEHSLYCATLDDYLQFL